MELKYLMKLDSSGRVVIPKLVRTSLGLEPGDDLEVCFDNTSNKVYFTKKREGCSFCGKEQSDMVIIKGHKVCKNCLNEIMSY